jgi:hypothetical protein
MTRVGFPMFLRLYLQLGLPRQSNGHVFYTVLEFYHLGFSQRRLARSLTSVLLLYLTTIYTIRPLHSLADFGLTGTPHVLASQLL